MAHPRYTSSNMVYGTAINDIFTRSRMPSLWPWRNRSSHLHSHTVPYDSSLSRDTPPFQSPTQRWDDWELSEDRLHRPSPETHSKTTPMPIPRTLPLEPFASPRIMRRSGTTAAKRKSRDVQSMVEKAAKARYLSSPQARSRRPCSENIGSTSYASITTEEGNSPVPWTLYEENMALADMGLSSLSDESSAWLSPESSTHAGAPDFHAPDTAFQRLYADDPELAFLHAFNSSSFSNAEDFTSSPNPLWSDLFEEPELALFDESERHSGSPTHSQLSTVTFDPALYSLDSGSPALVAPTLSRHDSVLSECENKRTPNTATQICLRQSSSCEICGACFTTNLALENHAELEDHRAFRCPEPGCYHACHRRDLLHRHRRYHKASRDHECKYCDDHKGCDAFKRRDALEVHMKRVHPKEWEKQLVKHCPYADCEYAKSGFRFVSGVQYRSHMAQAHGDGKKDCPVKDCKRVGKDGFKRTKDLEEHIKRKHPLELRFTGGMSTAPV